MTFFGGGGRSPTAPPRPPGRPDAKSILPVGSRALVTQDGSGEGSVLLSDEPGTAIVGSVQVGTEVELTAWRPRAGWGTRYRIHVADGTDGWLDVANLQGRPQPAPRPSPAKPVADPVAARSKRARKAKTS